MKTFLAAATLIALVSPPAFAKNFAVPSDDPAITVALPDSWTLSDIDYGHAAVSSDKDIFFSVEFANGKTLNAMMDLNQSWLKENNIKLKGKPAEAKEDFHGLTADLLLCEGIDEEGPTKVTFGFIDAGKDRVVMLTLWGSSEQRSAHAEEIAKILSSIKPIE